MGRIGITQMIQDEQTVVVKEAVVRDLVRDSRPETDWRSRKEPQQATAYRPTSQKPKRKRGKEGRKSRRRTRLEWRDRDREWETQQSHWKKYPQEQQKRVLVESIRLWW